MAEILISLTIIGVIAAITLPALVGNINESAWSAQRKALYSRLSQALSMMPSLNGYGEYEGTWSNDSVTVMKDTAAQAFVTDGLSKVLQITNVCPSGKLKDCGIPDKISTLANQKIKFPTNLTELNPMFTSTYDNTYSQPQKNINTNAVSFETKNGESVAVFYNPYCQSDMGEKDWYYTQPKMCANFIYDLNGRKGPNKVGKDIGFITALYPTDSEVVAPMPLEKKSTSASSQISANAICFKQNPNSRLPNKNELTAMFYNKQLIGYSTILSNHRLWSSSAISLSRAWNLSFESGSINSYPRKSSYYFWCIKRK